MEKLAEQNNTATEQHELQESLEDIVLFINNVELMPEKKRIVIFGSNGSGAFEALDDFEKFIKKNNLAAEVVATRWTEGIDAVFYDTAGKEQQDPADLVIAFSEMRQHDGNQNTTVNTPLKYIEQLCKENGAGFAYFKNYDAQEIASALNKTIES